MHSADFRLTEGSQALTIALNIGRTQEALYRVASHDPLTKEDSSYFEQLADLFFEAEEGFRWVEDALGSTPRPFQTGTSRQLKAFTLVLPALRDDTNIAPGRTLERLHQSASAYAAGNPVTPEERDLLRIVLDKLASHATGQGIAALETIPPFDAFSELP